MRIQERTSNKQKLALRIFGLFLCAVLLEAGLRIGGFTLSSRQEYRNRTVTKQKGDFHILCLGESTTAHGGGNSYPRQLEKILNKQNIGIKFKVINKGVSGTESTSIVAALEKNISKYNPDMIIVMMGINDEEDTVAYVDIPSKKTVLFFKSIRIYKLAKLLRLHIMHKIGEKKPEIYGIGKSIFKEASDLTQTNSSLEYEKSLKKALSINPKNDEAYVGLANYYWDQGRLDEAKIMLEKASAINPKNDEAYKKLGEYYKHAGNLEKAEETFKKVEEILKEIIEIDPENNDAYVGLAEYYYREQGKLDDAIQILEKALAINPKSDETYEELGKYYLYGGNLDKAEEVLEKAVEINPENDEAYRDLGMYYRMHKKFNKAQEALEKSIELDPESEEAHNELLVLLNEKQNKRKVADVHSQKTSEIQAGWYQHVTIHNYQILKKTITKKGIKLVCMQYPIRSVEPLKKIFKDNEHVVFVDNEKIFKEAVAREGYNKYFLDTIGKDFGHCTVKGDRLLAKNTADVILKEFFR